VKKKRLSAVLGCLLAFAILAGIAVPFASAAAADETIEFLNPLGTFMPNDNQPLAGRASLAGKSVALCYYAKDANREALTALGRMLLIEYGAICTEVAIANTAAVLTAAQCGELAQYDAVILGVADEAVCAWWSVSQAKQLEALGVPVALVTTSSYETIISCAAKDVGFTSVRTAVIDKKWYSKAYTKLGTFEGGVTYMTDYVLTLPNIDGKLANRGTVYVQVKNALTVQLTDEEKAPHVITLAELGVPEWQTSSVAGATYEDALMAFNQFAMDNSFGDGLPLVPPDQELVDDMLAATTRGKDEVLGKMMPRGGIITIEKIAINSVMAGLDPKSFPVVIAAMEAYASGYETDKTFYHAMMAGNGFYTIMLIINGPLGVELEVNGGRGSGSSGREANNTIGRAFRLCIRNIGHAADIDESNRRGRENDHALYVIREQEELMPPGWLPHNEMMGYAAGTSTITLHAYWTTNEWYGGDTFGYTTMGVLGHMRNGIFKDGGDKDLAVLAISPGQAWNTHQEANLPSKDAMRNYMCSIGVNTAPGGSAQYETFGLTTNASARIGDKLLVWPVIVGGDPYYTRVYTGSGYGTRGFTTQLISGATLTASGLGATAPSAPLDAIFSYNAARTAAEVAWSAPVSDGGSAITSYQASKDGGATWVDVGLQMSCVFTGLAVGEQCTFLARAVNGVVNAAEITGAAGSMAIDNRLSGHGAWAFAEAGFMPITSVKIDASNLTSMPRNTKKQFSVVVNEFASAEGIIWVSADTSFATVDQTGLVTVKNKMGTVILNARDPVSGISATIVLRIT
jgi:hypothetical protein